MTTPKAYANFEVSVNVVDSGSDLLVECDYNADLFDGYRVEVVNPDAQPAWRSLGWTSVV